MDLSIIIVNYKSSDKTIKCVNSIQKFDLGDILFEIIIVDNKPENNELSEIKNSFKNLGININYIQSKKNLGMGGGNNLGIESASGKYILILNPDIIVKKDSIKILYNYLKNSKEVGIVGPKLIYPNGDLQYSCFRGWKKYTPFLRRTFLGKIFKKQLNGFLMKDKDHDKVMTADWIMGSCLMFEKKILDDIDGGFDERFFMYFEDTDLCRRIKQLGKKVVYNPESVVVHNHGRESAREAWYISPFVSKLTREHIKSYIKYFLKWYGK